MTRLVVTQPGLDSGPCGACQALYGATCCESKTGEGPRLPMTFGEAARLARYKGVDLDHAVAIRGGITEVERIGLQMSAGGSVASLVVLGTALYLPMVGGRCAYLGPTGCTVPGVKPHLCALFPFTWGLRGWELGKIVQGSGFCYGQDVSAGHLATALKTFGVSVSDLDRVRDRWLRDKASHRTRLRQWLKGKGI